MPDPSCNPYLAFSAMLMAGLDGIRNKIEPPTPIDKDLYELPPDEHANIPQVPGSLAEVLDALEADHAYLLEGGVFTPDLIETWIDYKRDQRDRPDPAAPAPARVRALLRHLGHTPGLTWGFIRHCQRQSAASPPEQPAPKTRRPGWTRLRPATADRRCPASASPMRVAAAPVEVLG